MGNLSDYKQTEIGRIPKEWEVIKFREVFSYIKGKKPIELIDEYRENYLPYLSTEYLRENKSIKFAKISEDLVPINKGELILLWDGSNAGEFFMGKEGALSSTMVKLQIKKENIDSVFMFYLLKTKEYYLSRLTRGTGIPHVDKNVLENLTLPLPPLPEQKKIAEILSTVDAAIEKVNDAIAKTERLKKGLMQKLLTKGIGHKEFKDTEIGRIPKEWEVVKVEEIFSLEYGKGLTEKERENGEFPVYGSNGVVGYHSQYIVKGPGIIVGRKGTIGAVAWSDKNFWPIDTTYYVSLKKSETDLKWLFYKLLSLNLARLNMATGTPGLNRDLVYRIKLPLPPLPEQHKIAEILSTVDKRVELLRNKKEKLTRVKKGLMNDLLTGKKRVKV